MPIYYNQIKLIHVAKRELGLDSDTYKDILKQFGGVESSKDLTLETFQEVMTYFESCGFEIKTQKAKPKSNNYLDHLKKWEKRGSRPGMATSKELAMIEANWDGMHWYWASDGFGDRDKALRGFLLKRFQISDLRFLNKQQAHGCIEALKGIKNRRKAEG